jgi:hypothetical protein
VAASSLLLLIDDIASVLDDVATLTKVATKKTAGVLGDDLALNAQQVAGVRADRELPVVWAVMRGSALNKAILVPAALAISAFAHWLVTPLLMLGGAYLCFEGFEKIVHALLHKDEEEAHRREHHALVADAAVDLVALEKEKIKGAIRTDFILSAEIVVIALGTVAEQPLAGQFAVLVVLSVLMTLGVYGLVAGIVKLDDVGLFFSKSASAAIAAIGRGVLTLAPLLMKGLSVVGTVAMFLVGGNILLHGIHPLEEAAQAWLTGLGGVGEALGGLLVDLVAGLIGGALTLGVVTIGRRLVGALLPAKNA